MLGYYSFHTLFQKLSGSHKALVEMQDDVSELLRSATREYKQTKVCFQPHQYILLLEMPHYRVAVAINTPSGHKLSCTIVQFVMTEYPSEWDQTTDLQRSEVHLST